MHNICGSKCIAIRKASLFNEMFIPLSKISKDGSTLEPLINIVSPKTGMVKTFFNTGRYWIMNETKENVLTYRDTLDKNPDFVNILYVMLDQ